MLPVRRNNIKVQVACVLKPVFGEWTISSQLFQSHPESQTRARSAAQTKESTGLNLKDSHWSSGWTLHFLAFCIAWADPCPAFTPAPRLSERMTSNGTSTHRRFSVSVPQSLHGGCTLCYYCLDLALDSPGDLRHCSLPPMNSSKMNRGCVGDRWFIVEKSRTHSTEVRMDNCQKDCCVNWHFGRLYTISKVKKKKKKKGKYKEELFPGHGSLSRQLMEPLGLI